MDETTTTSEATTTTESNWYDGRNVEGDRLAEFQRYTSASAWDDAHFAQKSQISKSMVPPDPTSENYITQVKQARLKLGAKANASEYTVTIPEDIDGLDRDAFTKQVTDRAVKFGVTQGELDSEVTTALDEFKKSHAESIKAAEAAENEKSNVIRQTDESLSHLWGARKEAQMNNAMLMAKHYDDGMFAEENGQLSEEVRAEKGGIMVQRLKQSNDPVMYRLFAVLHDKILSEGTPPPGGRPAMGQPTTNVQMLRYEEAKAKWPMRGEETWQRYAEGR